MVFNQPWMLGVFIVVFFPPIVLIRWGLRGKVTSADLVLVILTVLPGLIFGFQEVTNPRSPNVPWLAPLLLVYLLAPILIARLQIPGGNTCHEPLRQSTIEEAQREEAQQDAPSNR